MIPPSIRPPAPSTVRPPRPLLPIRLSRQFSPRQSFQLLPPTQIRIRRGNSLDDPILRPIGSGMAHSHAAAVPFRRRRRWLPFLLSPCEIYLPLDCLAARGAPRRTGGPHDLRCERGVVRVGDKTAPNGAIIVIFIAPRRTFVFRDAASHRQESERLEREMECSAKHRRQAGP